MIYYVILYDTILYHNILTVLYFIYGTILNYTILYLMPCCTEV